MPSSANQQLIANLQDRIDASGGGHVRKRAHLPFGVDEIDVWLPGGGSAFECVHEIVGGGNDVTWGAVSSLFATGVVAGTKGPIVWCFTRTDLFAPGLVQVGLNIERVIFCESPNEDSFLECAEDALRYGGLSAVVAEVVRLPMVASRRLRLAAEHSGTMGITIQRWRRRAEATDVGQQTASITRRRVSALPSEPLPVEGIGRARWFVERLRARAGESFAVEVNACDRWGRMCSTTQTSDDWRIAL